MGHIWNLYAKKLTNYLYKKNIFYYFHLLLEKMIKGLIFLLLTPAIICVSNNDSLQESSDVIALKAKMERMMIPAFTSVQRIETLFLGTKNYRLDWSKGVKRCKQFGAKLATLTSIRKQNIVKSRKFDGHVCGTMNSAYHWTWCTGENVRPNSQQWYTGHPAYYNCLRFAYTQKFFVPITCGSKYPIACEKSGLFESSSEFTAHKIKTTYMFVFTANLSFNQAITVCKGIDPRAHLATPTSFNELAWIENQSLGSSKKSARLWLGGKRLRYFETGKWLTGEPIISNLRKFRRENGGKCLMYYYAGSKNRYFDWVKCDGKNDWTRTTGFVCQIDH